MNKQKLKILFVSSEVFPFSQTGGLGDVSGTLPIYLKKLGHDIRVVTPRYYIIDKQKYKLSRHLAPLGVPIGWGEEWAAIYEGIMGTGKNSLPIFFLDHERFFGRKGLYADASNNSYPDNLERFTFLSRGALQLAKYLNFIPDLIHVNDWQTALIPIYLNTWERNSPLGQAASILSLHNVAYQGDFDKNLIFQTQLGWEHFHYTGLEHHDRLNLLKGGIYHATKVTTVSPTYAQEIQTPAGGDGLHGALQDRRLDLSGILNGIDYKVWDPMKDPYIASPFSHKNLEGKNNCKSDLQRTFNLEVTNKKPIVAMVTRLAWQKGIDMVAAAIDKIMALDLQFILLGEGETWANLFFGNLPNRYPGKAGVFIGFNAALAHKIEAGADLFLMPSRFEPCGLNQMYSQRYGTLPIVRHTGGLADTVINFSEALKPSQEKGTGFVFHDLTDNAINDTIGWALYTYFNKPEHWGKMRLNAMRKDFSWEKSALEYEALYFEAIRKRQGIQ